LKPPSKGTAHLPGFLKIHKTNQILAHIMPASKKTPSFPKLRPAMHTNGTLAKKLPTYKQHLAEDEVSHLCSTYTGRNEEEALLKIVDTFRSELSTVKVPPVAYLPATQGEEWQPEDLNVEIFKQYKAIVMHTSSSKVATEQKILLFYQSVQTMSRVANDRHARHMQRVKEADMLEERLASL